MSQEERRLHPALRELKHGIVHLGDEFHSLSVYRLATLIIDVGGIIMAEIDNLTAAVADLETKVSTEDQTLQTVAASLRTTADELAALQQQGTPVTAEQLNSLTARVTAVAQAASDATSAAQATTTAPPASGAVDPAAPADPTAPADPAAPTP